MKKIIIITVVIGLAALAGFTLMSNKSEMEEQARLAQEKNESVSVVVATVSKVTMKDNFSATGNFESFREVEVASLAQGKIERIVVKEGQDVREGQLIAKLDSDLIEADLLAAEASVAKTKKDLERYEELAPRGAATPQQLDEINLAYKSAVARHATVKKQLANATIKAPFSGTINERFVEPGSYLAAGGKIVELVDVHTLKMKVAVSESEVLKLHKGQSVKVSADALGDVSFPGTISFIGVKADKSLRYAVEIKIKNNSNKTLKAGMYGAADFEFNDSKEALVIPREAIAGSIKEPKVFVIENGKAILTNIQIGTIEKNYVEVRNGLAEGTQVVIDGQINLENGSAVSISATKKK